VAKDKVAYKVKAALAATDKRMDGIYLVFYGAKGRTKNDVDITVTFPDGTQAKLLSNDNVPSRASTAIGKFVKVHLDKFKTAGATDWQKAAPFDLKWKPGTLFEIKANFDFPNDDKSCTMYLQE